MRGEDVTQGSLFSYIDLDERVPKGHPLRKMRLLVNAVLKSMSGEFAALYLHTGAPRSHRRGCCGPCCCK